MGWMGTHEANLPYDSRPNGVLLAKTSHGVVGTSLVS